MTKEIKYPEKMAFTLSGTNVLYITALADNEYGGNKSLAIRKMIEYHQKHYAKEVLKNER